MMQVPEGQVAVTINNGISGERHVKVVSTNTQVSDVLEDLGIEADLNKITLRLRNGTDIRSIDNLNDRITDGDVLTISPSKQGAGA